MSIETPSATHIQVENVSDYTQYFNQVAEAVARGSVGTVTFVSQGDSLSLSQDQSDLAHQLPHAVVFEHITEADAEHAVVAEAAAVLSPVRLEPAQPIHTTAAEAIIKPPVGKGPYRCETCDKVFQKWNQLQRHIKTHDDDKPFRCTQCNDSFNVEDNLKLHMATHPQNDNRQPTCPECGKTFTRTASLKAHIILHVKEENLMCTECGDEFSLQSQLDRHMREHRQDQEGKRSYPCRQCTQEFPKMTLLREHMKQHYRIKSSLSHRSYKRNIDRSSFHHKCIHCGKSFQKPSQVLRHIRIHTGERPFDCKMCDKSFNQKGALQIHMTKHTGERPHMCEFCSATFSQKGNLRAHIQRVHSLSKDADGPNFQCDECSCVFRKLGSLNAHISRSHSESADLPGQVEVQPLADSDKVIHQIIELSVQSGAKDINGQAEPVNADILQQALENSGLPSVNVGGEQEGTEDANGNAVQVPVSLSQTISTMAVHDAVTGSTKRHTIRKVNGVRWHQCTYCTKEFKKPSDLVRHIRIHTHEKPYKCNQCFRAFAVKSTLTAHLKTHTGVKEYKCEVCNKMFSTLGSLRVHSRLHTGAKPFDCSQCERKFRTSAHLKSHLVSHFKDITLPKKPRRPVRKPSKPDIPLPEIALQEPILITDTGLIQPPSRSNFFNNYLNEITSDRPHKCAYCQRGFKKSSHLKQHVRSHTGEKPYQCKLCHRSFVSSGVLKSHSRTHTGVKAYKCSVCDSSFTTSGSLKRHNSTHTEIRPFMCPYCQKTFKTSVNCKKHMKTHRHELAMQALQEEQSLQSQNVQQNSIVENDEHGTDSEALTSQTSNVPTIDSGHPEASTAAAALQESSIPTELTDISQGDLTGPNNAVLSQETIPDVLLEQVFSPQNFLGNQQNFAQMNAFSQGQITLPNTQQLTNVIDVTPLSASFASTLASTPILTTSCREPQLTPVQQQRQVNMQREMDEGKRSYKCTYCGKGFKKSSHLKQHIRSHTGEKPYKCTQCNRMFVSTGVLKAHMRTHTGVKDYRCQICHAAFTTNGSLTRHMIIHSNTETFKCPYCTETFRISSLYRRHLKMHKNNQIDDDDYSNGSRRNRPVIQISEEEAQELTKTGPHEEMTVSQRILIECTTEKDRVSEIRLPPQPMHEPIPEKIVEKDTYPKHPHECSKCPKSFKKPSDLVRHVRIHTGEKPFKCSICAKSFTVKSTLDSHMKTHRPGEKKFKCHVCTLPFSTKGSLKVHMRLHTGAKPFKCPHCELRFRTSGHRKSHIASHFKSDTPKKRKTTKVAAMDTTALLVTTAVDTQQQPQQQQHQPSQSPQETQVMTSIQNAVEMSQGLHSTNPLSGQVVSIEPTMLPNQPGLVPVSLTVSGSEQLVGNGVVGSTTGNGTTTVASSGGVTVANGGSQLSESALAANVLQGLEGIQLQLSGNLSQSIQIMGLDPSLISQTIQIDDSLLQQLQQGSLNFTLAPNFVSSTPTQIQLQPQSQTVMAPAGQELPAGITAGTTIAQLMPNTIQIHPVTMQDPNIVMQPLSTITMAQNQGVADQTQQALHAAVVMNGQETGLGPQSNFIVTDAGDTQISVDAVSDVQGESSPNMVAESDNLDSVHDAATAMMENEAVDMIDGSVNDDGLGSIDSKGNHVCHFCSKTFKRPSNLKEHIANVHENDSPNQKKLKRTPHVCTICTKAFQKPSQLERHIRIHTGERPFKCPKCTKRFNQKNALQIHLKQHSGEKPYKCTYCDLAFIQKGNLKTHIKRAHHIEMVQSMNLPHTIVPSVTLSVDTVSGNNPVVVTAASGIDAAGGSSPKESGLDLADLFLGNSTVD